MFTRKANMIESYEGFSIKILGLTGLKYTQGDKTLSIDSEFLAFPHGITIFAQNITRWDSGKPIDENTKKKIIDNIFRAFKWEGTKVEVRL